MVLINTTLHITKRKFIVCLQALKRYLSLLLLIVAAGHTLAQSDGFDRPSERRPKLPEFQSPIQGQILPRVVLPESGTLGSMAAGRSIYVHDYRIEGSTIFDAEELAKVSAPYRNREVSFADIEELRTTITEAYIYRGYVNSGALIPDQDVTDGIVEIRIVEGKLVQVDVNSDGRLSMSAARYRLQRKASPLNVFAIEEQLQLLLQDPRVKKLEAKLTPGEHPGDGRLSVNIEEADPWLVSATESNEQSPAVGETALRLTIEHLNVFGFNDAISFSSTVNEGLRNGDLVYTVPINSYGTTLALRGYISESEIVEAPFDTLNIESEATTFGLKISHPLWGTLKSRLDLFLNGELKRTENSLLGRGFSFTPATEDGEAKATVLRFGEDYTFRSNNQVFALRTTISVGIDAADATINKGPIADGEFVVGLVQAQLARRFEFLDSQLLARLDTQFSDSALLNMEQFAIGGVRTVRGYADNTLITDNGIVGSLEWRVPVWRSGRGKSTLELVPFVDYGKGWNTDRDDPDTDRLLSVGLGALLQAGDRCRLELWYGEALEDDIVEPIGSSLQEDGFSFSVSVRFL